MIREIGGLEMVVSQAVTDRKVTFSFNDPSVYDLLDKVLPAYGITFEVLDFGEVFIFDPNRQQMPQFFELSQVSETLRKSFKQTIPGLVDAVSINIGQF